MDWDWEKNSGNIKESIKKILISFKKLNKTIINKNIRFTWKIFEGRGINHDPNSELN